MSLKPLSKSVISLSKPVFQRKYIKLGRIYSYWPQIIGEEYAEKALPVELKTRAVKIKGVKKDAKKQFDIYATLHIITDGATALPLSYQKERILGRIEHLFGERIVSDIKIIQNHLAQKKSTANDKIAITAADKQEISAMIEKIDDDTLRERLESFGQSLYQSGKEN